MTQPLYNEPNINFNSEIESSGEGSGHWLGEGSGNSLGESSGDGSEENFGNEYEYDYYGPYGPPNGPPFNPTYGAPEVDLSSGEESGGPPEDSSEAESGDSGLIFAESFLDFEFLYNERECVFYGNQTNAIFDSGRPYHNHKS